MVAIKGEIRVYPKNHWEFSQTLSEMSPTEWGVPTDPKDLPADPLQVYKGLPADPLRSVE